MPKGQKTDKLTTYKIMLKMFDCDNLSQTSKELKIPISTVDKIYKKNKEKKEFISLKKKQEKKFLDKANSIISKATDVLEKRLDIALQNQQELEEIIDIIYDVEKIDDEKLNYKQKESLIKKVSKLQLNNLTELTTAIGTLYDKRALELGTPTANNNVTINIELSDE